MTEPSEQTNQTEDTPLPSFDEMPLSDDVKEALSDMGYTQPALVQHAVYDPAVRGQDVVVQARTGTGKTAAFGIPLVDQMIKRSLNAPQALVLTPTRELALQVSREIEHIGAKRGIVPVSVYGGAPIQRQIDALQRGAQIVVGTPGRVLDHMRRGTLDPKDLRILILDESDEMLSMGFEKELHAIVDYMPEQKQTLLFSATLPPEIVRMASTRLHDPQFIYLSGDHIGALEILHFVYFVMQDKSDILIRMLEVEDPESALIFCNTRDETERVAGVLQRAGYDADWLNGDLPQSEREKVMGRSKEGKLRFLVATDVAARGIDISHLTHVINYDFPESTEVYVHRTGRTGRMGKTGTAISLITPHDIGSLYYLRLIYKIRPFEKQLPTEGELKTRAQTDIIAMLAQAFASEPPHPDDISLARRLLTHDRCEHILAGLLRNHLGDRIKSQEQASETRRGRRPRVAPTKNTRSPRLNARPERSQGRKRRNASDKKRVETPELDPRENEAEQDRGEQTDKGERRERTPRAQRPRQRRERTEGHKPEASFDSFEQNSEENHDIADLDLPSYQMTPMTDDALDPVQDDVSRIEAEGHAALIDWSPPQEDNDDQPILMSNSSSPDSDDVESELFVSVGRRDGARPGDFVAMLAEAPGICRDDIGRIRIRDKHTFIAVQADVIEAAIDALHGKSINGRVANAERAHPRDE